MLPEKDSPRTSLRHRITKVTHCLVWGQVPAGNLSKLWKEDIGLIVV